MNRRKVATLGATSLIAPFTPSGWFRPFGVSKSLGQTAVTATAAADLNDAGQIVGWHLRDMSLSALLWEEGTPVLLEPLPGHRGSAAYTINNDGLIAGESRVDHLDYRAVLWDRGQVVELPCPDADASCKAYAINDPGQIVGNMSGTTEQAVLWQDGEPMRLEPLPDDTNCIAEAINSAGLIAGSSWGTGVAKPVVWDEGRSISLPTTLKRGGGYGQGISRTGQVVGRLYHVALGTSFYAGGAVYWERREDAGEWVLTELVGLPASNDTSARDINDVGQIVGTSVSAAINHALLWEEGVLTDLGASLPEDESTVANAINAFGQISGQHAAQAATWIDGELVDLPLPEDI